jgi:tetratricopeptide (TPR) repeat protein
MRCETARRIMMDRLYETVAPDQLKKLEAHLLGCPQCAAEWDDVQRAHQMMASGLTQEVPMYLDQAILSQTNAQTAPVPARRRFGWRRMAAAASFLIIAGISYQVWQKDDSVLSMQSDLSPNRSIKTDIPANKEGALASPEMIQLKALGYSNTAPAPSLMKSKQNAKLTSSQPQQSVQPAILPPRHESSSKAEESFHTSLKLYNKAFTKTGDDKRALLRSGIIMLQDIETQFPEDGQWIALSMILIADSYRELGETDKAIETYQHITEQFSYLPVYSRQARASMLKLMLDKPQVDLDQAESILVQYQEQQPAPTEFVKLALAYSAKVNSSSPEHAYEWYNKIKKCLPAQHPLIEKVNKESRDIELKLRYRQYIMDWRIVGPLEQTVLPDVSRAGYIEKLFNPKKNILNRIQRLVIKKSKRYEHAPRVNLLRLFTQSPLHSCAFTYTNIYSPKKQNVHLLVGFSDGLRIWLNGEQISGGLESDGYSRDFTSINCKLQKGWNELLFKSYNRVHHEDSRVWQFSALIVDNNGELMPELKYSVDPTK